MGEVEGQAAELSILVITNAYPNPSRNYFANQFVKDQVDSLRSLVRAVNVVFPHPILPIRPFRRTQRYDNVQVFFPYYYTPYTYHKRKGDWEEHVSGIYARQVLKTVRRRKLDVDLIHAHFSFPSGNAAVRLGKELGVPVVTTIHENQEWFLELIGQEPPAYMTAWKESSLLIRVNKKDASLLRKHNQNVLWIPNGYNPSSYHLDPNVRRRPNLIFAMGALNERKGFQFLIEAVGHVRRAIPDVRCCIAGKDDGYGPRLEEMIESAGLQRNVHLIGPVSTARARQLMNECTVFCHPSRSESFGVVQIEAMACGAPVIATFNGASEDIIPEGCGLVVPREEIEGALLRGLSEIRWDNQSIAERVERFSWDNVAKTLSAEYFKLSERGAPMGGGVGL